jgi:hypothetical protein
MNDCNDATKEKNTVPVNINVSTFNQCLMATGRGGEGA